MLTQACPASWDQQPLKLGLQLPQQQLVRFT
jgi:hypothetical protein